MSKITPETNSQALDLWREFIRLLEIREESDSGREFSPNRIHSCRVMDGQQMNDIIAAAKTLLDTQSKH
jgi:hypothetical protein